MGDGVGGCEPYHLNGLRLPARCGSAAGRAGPGGAIPREPAVKSIPVRFARQRRPMRTERRVGSGARMGRIAPAGVRIHGNMDCIQISVVTSFQIRY